VYESIIPQPPPFGIGRNIGKLIAEIQTIANSVLVKSGLPDFSRKLRPNLMREPFLDALSATLDGLTGAWSQQDMKMLWHNGKTMQLVTSLIAIVKEHSNQQFRICGPDKERTPLIGRRGKRVSVHG